jgi:hypothetical protein
MMDESLANGFKNQFFRYVQEDLDAAFARATKAHNKVDYYAKLSNWNKFTASLVPALGDIAITHCNGGSKRKPYLGIALLGVDEARQYNHWEEKCLECYDELFNYDPPFFQNYEATAYIGEHAVMRLYQRSFNAEKFRNHEITHMEILKELKYVPLWSNYWPQLFYYLNKHNYKIEKLKPVIPTPKGLFLCEYSTANRYHLDIRTFVNTEQLREDQSKLRAILLKAGESLSEAPISFMSTLLTTALDYPIEQVHKVSMGLVNHTGLLANQMSNDPAFAKHLVNFVIREIDRLEDYVYYEEHPMTATKDVARRNAINAVKEK